MERYKIGQKVRRNPNAIKKGALNTKSWAKDKHPLIVIEIDPTVVGEKLKNYYRVKTHEGDTTVYMHKELIPIKGAIVKDDSLRQIIAKAKKIHAFHMNDGLLAGFSYQDLIDTVTSNEETVDDDAIIRTFKRYVAMQEKDALADLKKNMKTVLKSISPEEEGKGFKSRWTDSGRTQR